LACDQGAGGGLNSPLISLIAAVARNGTIGAGNALPWRIPSDLRRFKLLTMGKPLIIGRKTFEAIGKPLPGRETIVVTRERGWSFAGIAVAHEIDAALDIARERKPSEIIIGGGGQIYTQAFGIADRLYITEVDLSPVGDAWFPAIDKSRWREVRREAGEKAPRDEADFVFVEFERMGCGVRSGPENRSTLTR
jgi:dihydrofolate reductase